MKTSKVNVCRAYVHRASGRRIAEEIAVIRTALKRLGYPVRKQPKQAAWAVYVSDDKFYLLTFQPAPISAWVLHPQDNDISGDTLSTIIQRAYNPTTCKHDQEEIMTYLERLSPWCIVKLLPNMQQQVVARCRRRNDAEEHLRILSRLLPSARFVIAFDPALEQQDSSDGGD